MPARPPKCCSRRSRPTMRRVPASGPRTPSANVFRVRPLDIRGQLRTSRTQIKLSGRGPRQTHNLLCRAAPRKIRKSTRVPLKKKGPPHPLKKNYIPKLRTCFSMKKLRKKLLRLRARGRNARRHDCRTTGGHRRPTSNLPGRCCLATACSSRPTNSATTGIPRTVPRSATGRRRGATGAETA